MKNIFAVTCALIALISAGCVHTKLPEEKTIAETRQRTAADQELILKEKEIWDAYKEKDAKVLRELLADDYYAIEDADGDIMNKTQALQSLSGLDLKNYQMKDMAVIEINEGSAIVRYKVKMQGAAYEHAFVPRWSAVSSIWVKRAGKWRNLMYQETKIGE